MAAAAVAVGQVVADPCVRAESGAVFDLSGRYRYFLWRRWEAGLPVVGFVMLNPNSADAERADPTIRRCVGFARGWGYGGIVAVNVFALRAASPSELRQVADPRGPENDGFVELAARLSDLVVAAWGNHADSVACGSVCALLPSGTRCLGLTKRNQPRHPLYVRGSSTTVPFQP